MPVNRERVVSPSELVDRPMTTRLFDGGWVILFTEEIDLSGPEPYGNHRVFVFRLEEGGRSVLFVANPTRVCPGLFDAVRALEAEAGCPVKHVMSISGFHHLHMAEWARAFPAASHWFPPARIPRTTNGKMLLAEGLARPPEDAKDPFPQLAGEMAFVYLSGFKAPTEDFASSERWDADEYALVHRRARALFTGDTLSSLDPPHWYSEYFPVDDKTVLGRGVERVLAEKFDSWLTIHVDCNNYLPRPGHDETAKELFAGAFKFLD